MDISQAYSLLPSALLAQLVNIAPTGSLAAIAALVTTVLPSLILLLHQVSIQMWDIPVLRAPIALLVHFCPSLVQRVLSCLLLVVVNSLTARPVKQAISVSRVTLTRSFVLLACTVPLTKLWVSAPFPPIPWWRVLATARFVLRVLQATGADSLLCQTHTRARVPLANIARRVPCCLWIVLPAPTRPQRVRLLPPAALHARSLSIVRTVL
jgi:hypothetical protein